MAWRVDRFSRVAGSSNVFWWSLIRRRAATAFGSLDAAAQRAVLIISLVVGLFAAGFCFLGLAGAALPYQDPTAEMLLSQSRQVRRWLAGMLIGLVIAGVAGVALWRLRRTTRGS